MTERPRPEDHTPNAEAVLTPDAQALQALLLKKLQKFGAMGGVAVDLPVIIVDPQHVEEVCRIAKEDPEFSFKMLLCIAGVDYEEYIQVVYVMLSLEYEQTLILKTDLPYQELNIPTVSSVWKAANWYEREAQDLFGIQFVNHPDPRPLILYEEFNGYPGRKDHPFYDYQEY